MEEVKRTDTENLFNYTGLTELQKENRTLNIKESNSGELTLQSFPRRIVLELTNSFALPNSFSENKQIDITPSFLNVEWLKPLQSAFRYAEEVTFAGCGEPSLHPKFQAFLEFASNFPVKKYIRTNGLNLDVMSPWIFEYDINLIAINLDSPDAKINNSLRPGSDFNKITKNIKDLVVRRYFANVKPYINTVTTLRKSNLETLPDMVTLAAELDIEEVKAVYFTAFSKEHESETLYNIPEKTREIFEIAAEKADRYNITLTLPHILGEDPSMNNNHKHCHLAWRDLFIGSDGVIRSCKSTENTLLKIPANGVQFKSEVWNSKEFIDFRERVNSSDTLMNHACKTCYQSSCANWNKKRSFIQVT